MSDIRPPEIEIKKEIDIELEKEEELKQLEEQLRVNLDADYFKWKDEQEEHNW